MNEPLQTVLFLLAMVALWNAWEWIARQRSRHRQFGQGMERRLDEMAEGSETWAGRGEG